MNSYGIYNATSGVINRIISTDQNNIALNVQAGESAIILLNDETDDKFYVSNGIITAYTSTELQLIATLPIGCIWSMPSRAVVDTAVMADIQARACAAINVKRDAVIAAFDQFTYNGVVYDGDVLAQANIQMTIDVITAGIPLPANFEWRASDNSMHPMAAADVISMNAARLVAQATLVFATYSTSWTLKAQINSATTRQQVEAITWSS
ncbi:DUF4376 domain-containing protein [Solimicrobium silvestre]|uniref:DUF4376 domain-containing protein n=1 Tax=Solimicrobium silvestre TaxID=2099400 RepID=A0A2S9GY81_9BURK|nr:DUF4376 domain-containing protein [Solimicrobium silvestre]PRC92682.1 hypothetical protein S2091_2737 [Solimicrobium silvestre]